MCIPLHRRRRPITRFNSLLIFPTNDAKGPAPREGMCTLKFLSERGGKAGSKICLFSTGEVGHWRLMKPRSRIPILNSSYEKALESSSRFVEIEVPSQNRGDRSLLLYRLFMGTGTVQALAAVSKGKGNILFYPKGRIGGGGEEDNESNVEIGTVKMQVKGGKPIVDPSWARGRRWFWSSREVKGIRHCGSI